MNKATVYRESAQAILDTMRKSDRSVSDTGMYRFDLRMSADEASPILRALMRAEAELLLEEP